MSILYHLINVAPEQLIEITKKALMLTFLERVTLNFFNWVSSIWLTSTDLQDQLESAKQDGCHNFIFLETCLVVHTNTTSKYHY